MVILYKNRLKRRRSTTEWSFRLLLSLHFICVGRRSVRSLTRRLTGTGSAVFSNRRVGSAKNLFFMLRWRCLRALQRTKRSHALRTNYLNMVGLIAGSEHACSRHLSIKESWAGMLTLIHSKKHRYSYKCTIYR